MSHDVHPKFIIEDGAIIISKVTFHNEMVIDNNKVQGGGWFDINYEEHTITLYGSSDEFGPATLENIRKAVQDGKVYSNPFSDRSITDRFSMKYKNEGNGTNEIIDL